MEEFAESILTPRTVAAVFKDVVKDTSNQPDDLPTLVMQPVQMQPVQLQPEEEHVECKVHGESSPLGEQAVCSPLPQPQPDPAMTQLQDEMKRCFNLMMQRIDKIENNVNVIQQYLNDRMQHTQDVDCAVMNALNKNSQTQVSTPLSELAASPSGPQPYELRFEGMKNLWYTERILPPFLVNVVDSATGEVYRDTDGWSIQISLFNGNGIRADDRLGGDEEHKKPSVNHGIAEVSGLRYNQVSSKQGNFYVLTAKVTEPEDMAGKVAQARSENITVMSCRLFNSRKGSFSLLTKGDPVSKMPGIGTKYANRLGQVGIKTIGDLSQLPLDEAGHLKRAQILDAVRREKGSLTEVKLMEHIKTAQGIVHGEFSGKRKRGGGDYEVVVRSVEGDLAMQAPPAKRGPSFARRTAISPNEPLERGKLALDQVNQSAAQEAARAAASANVLNVSALQEHSMRRICNQPVSDQEFNYFLNPTAIEPITDLTGTDNNTTAPNEIPTNLNMHHRPSLDGTQTELLVGSDFFFRDVKVDKKQPLSSTETNDKETESGSKPKLKVVEAGLPPFPLHAAIATGQLKRCEAAVDALRAAERVVDRPNIESFTPLMWASALGHSHIVDWLCRLPEIRVSRSRPADGWNALHIATLGARDGCVGVLLKYLKPEEARLATKKGLTPLMLAVAQGNLTIVKLLQGTVGGKAPVVSSDGLSLYHFAVLSGKVDVFKAVHQLIEELQPLAEVDGEVVAATSSTSTEDKKEVVDGRVASLMHCACYRGDVETVKYLLELGVKAHLSCGGGWTPLHVCATRGFSECASLIAKADNVDVNAATRDGWTALSLTPMAGQGDAAATAEALLTAGAKDDGSRVPASMVSVVCANAPAWLVLGKARTASGWQVGGKHEIDAKQLGERLDHGDMLNLE